jgi:hypothetical protein
MCGRQLWLYKDVRTAAITIYRVWTADVTRYRYVDGRMWLYTDVRTAYVTIYRVWTEDVTTHRWRVYGECGSGSERERHIERTEAWERDVFIRGGKWVLCSAGCGHCRGRASGRSVVDIRTVVPVRVMRTYGGSRRTDPVILNLTTTSRWTRIVNFSTPT